MFATKSNTLIVHHDKEEKALSIEGVEYKGRTLWLPYDDEGCSIITFVREILVKNAIASDVCDLKRIANNCQAAMWRLEFKPLLSKQGG